MTDNSSEILAGRQVSDKPTSATTIELQSKAQSSSQSKDEQNETSSFRQDNLQEDESKDVVTTKEGQEEEEEEAVIDNLSIAGSSSVSSRCTVVEKAGKFDRREEGEDEVLFEFEKRKGCEVSGRLSSNGQILSAQDLLREDCQRRLAPKSEQIQADRGDEMLSQEQQQQHQRQNANSTICHAQPFNYMQESAPTTSNGHKQMMNDTYNSEMTAAPRSRRLGNGLGQVEETKICFASKRMKEYFENFKSHRGEKQRLYQFFKSIRSELAACLLFTLISAQALIVFRTSLGAVDPSQHWPPLAQSSSSSSKSLPARDVKSQAYVHLACGLVKAFTVASLTQMFGHISGCHLNPSISFALYIKNHISRARFISYLLAQCVGALSGGLLLLLLTSSQISSHGYWSKVFSVVHLQQQQQPLSGPPFSTMPNISLLPAIANQPGAPASPHSSSNSNPFHSDNEPMIPKFSTGHLMALERSMSSQQHQHQRKPFSLLLSAGGENIDTTATANQRSKRSSSAAQMMAPDSIRPVQEEPEEGEAENQLGKNTKLQVGIKMVPDNNKESPQKSRQQEAAAASQEEEELNLDKVEPSEAILLSIMESRAIDQKRLRGGQSSSSSSSSSSSLTTTPGNPTTFDIQEGAINIATGNGGGSGSANERDDNPLPEASTQTAHSSAGNQIQQEVPNDGSRAIEKHANQIENISSLTSSPGSSTQSQTHPNPQPSSIIHRVVKRRRKRFRAEEVLVNSTAPDQFNRRSQQDSAFYQHETGAPAEWLVQSATTTAEPPNQRYVNLLEFALPDKIMTAELIQDCIQSAITSSANNHIKQEVASFSQCLLLSNSSQMFIFQLIANVIIVLVYLVNVDPQRSDAGFKSLSIGLAYFVASIVCIHSGGFVGNPFELLSLSWLSTNGEWQPEWLVYLVAPLIGGLFGAISHEYMDFSSLRNRNRRQHLRRSFYSLNNLPAATQTKTRMAGAGGGSTFGCESSVASGSNCQPEAVTACSSSESLCLPHPTQSSRRLVAPGHQAATAAMAPAPTTTSSQVAKFEFEAEASVSNFRSPAQFGATCNGVSRKLVSCSSAASGNSAAAFRESNFDSNFLISGSPSSVARVASRSFT